MRGLERESANQTLKSEWWWCPAYHTFRRNSAKDRFWGGTKTGKYTWGIINSGSGTEVISTIVVTTEITNPGKDADSEQHEQAGPHSRPPCSSSQGQSLQGGCTVPEATCFTSATEACGITRAKACTLRNRQKQAMYSIFTCLHIIGISATDFIYDYSVCNWDPRFFWNWGQLAFSQMIWLLILFFHHFFARQRSINQR